VIPKYLVQAAEEECRKTLAGDNSVPIAERVRKMVAAFARFPVTAAQLETRAGKKLDALTSDDLVDLQGIYTSLKDNASRIEDWFGSDAADGQGAATPVQSAIAEQSKKGDQAAAGEKKTTRKAAETKAADTAKTDAAPAPAEAKVENKPETAKTVEPTKAETTKAAPPLPESGDDVF
jgi:hypothetical protein